jgi:putative oxidoreductase
MHCWWPEAKMAMHTTLAERVAYGTPADSEVDAEAPVRLVPRAGTAFLGRVLLSAIFLLSGFAKLTDPMGTAAYMTGAGIPNAQTLAIVVGLAEVLGGVAVLSGFLTRLGALGLFIYLIPTTLLFHGFWQFEGVEMKVQMASFMKNLAIMGGLLLLVAHGPGRNSVDAKLRRPLQP